MARACMLFVWPLSFAGGEVRRGLTVSLLCDEEGTGAGTATYAGSKAEEGGQSEMMRFTMHD